ncbi:MAG: methanol/ethanol family PQQ-dependent dehydrogenase [Acidobacteriaceae bacterium]|nr:methanol/ethanol family PQQ-dependent dehydrogenase [Acidobacteriaceae bacterium]MBV9678898.1 methanol/ethanol family PQQ-dependent dehydrogenase [Acidobacteriaceae bacterium]MBV9939179.1 methanol/ethanol family PQQ-dependent dehydrogenase [Acidobacteriaceae bacterium]
MNPGGGIRLTLAGSLLVLSGLAQIQNQPDDGQWIMAPKNHASTRYSTLNQINTENVRNLKPAFEFSTGTIRGNEAAPLVVNNTMYIVTPFPNFLYALDLTKPGAPMKWVYQPNPSPSAQGVACCDTVNRGAAYDKGRIYYNTLDVQTVAVDANTGKEVWRTKLGDINMGESITMAPIVAKGKVLVGNSGGEFGVRGWLAGLDADTGKIAWRAYATGPDKDVLIGPNFKPFYQKDRGTDLGVKTWPSEAWKIGGAAAWSWISYDPDLDLFYYGTSNPGPWNPEQRPGDNKWACTIFARRPETGEAVWAYQMTPHDLHDYDGINENILLDLTIGGSLRKVLAHPDRNGFLYLIDRQTGEVVSAEKFGYVNTIESVDVKTGELKYNPTKESGFKTVRDACPAPPGLKDWTPSSFSPRTGLIYLPHNNMCYEAQGTQANYIAGTPFVGMKVRMYAGPGGNRGILSAWDPVKAKTVWSINETFPVWSGTVVTAGDVVFYGTMDGWFKAVDARNGKSLWQFKVGSGIVGQPVTYKGPDGKQYVAILSGVGGWAGAAVSGGLNGVDGTGALGFLNATSDLGKYTTKGGMLYVFSLP